MVSITMGLRRCQLEAAADLGELLRSAGRLDQGIAVLLDTFELAKSSTEVSPNAGWRARIRAASAGLERRRPTARPRRPGAPIASSRWRADLATRQCVDAAQCSLIGGIG